MGATGAWHAKFDFYQYRTRAASSARIASTAAPFHPLMPDSGIRACGRGKDCALCAATPCEQNALAERLAEPRRRIANVVAASPDVDDITEFAQAAQGPGHDSRVHAGRRGHVRQRRQSLTRVVPACPDPVREAARRLHPLRAFPAADLGRRLAAHEPSPAVVAVPRTVTGTR